MATLAMPLPSIGIVAMALPTSCGESAAIGTGLFGISESGCSTVIPSCNQKHWDLLPSGMISGLCLAPSFVDMRQGQWHWQ